MWTVAIVSRESGVGKTMLAAQLAGASRHLRVAALDTDPKRDLLHWRLRRQGHPPIVEEATPGNLPGRLSALAAGGVGLCLVDTAADDHLALRQILPCCDQVLIPLSAQPSVPIVEDRVVALARLCGKPLLFSLVGADGRALADAVSHVDGFGTVLEAPIRPHPSVPQAMQDGRTVAEAGGLRSAREMEMLFGLIMEQLTGVTPRPEPLNRPRRLAGEGGTGLYPFAPALA